MKKLRCVLFVGILILEVMKGGDAMPNDDFYIICPYYHKTRGNELFCEGFSGNSGFLTDECFNKQVFATRAERNGFIKKFCGSFDYLHCTIAVLNEHLKQVK